MQSGEQQNLLLSDVIRGWLGWCPNAPAIRTAPAVLAVPPEAVLPVQPGGGPAAGSPGRIRDGMMVAGMADGRA